MKKKILIEEDTEKVGFIFINLKKEVNTIEILQKILTEFLSGIQWKKINEMGIL